ncbi:hypothetical protein ElyMa_001254200 [Elysia marginata]|uniref:Uncharacterized protein n=1 Tax=Elysia marginata TaxID=1093978 RepID=A0AAV4IHB0_9GAST|nr:hypothetical protein ElyMa_001254200 [Elysia marginata]
MAWGKVRVNCVYKEIVTLHDRESNLRPPDLESTLPRCPSTKVQHLQCKPYGKYCTLIIPGRATNAYLKRRHLYTSGLESKVVVVVAIVEVVVVVVAVVVLAVVVVIAVVFIPVVVVVEEVVVAVFVTVVLVAAAAAAAVVVVVVIVVVRL